jgi:hypothetical protein
MRNCVASLAILATLTFAATDLQAQNSLAPELLNKVLDLIATKGSDREIPAPLAEALGFSASGHGWAVRQVTAYDNKNSGVLHGFAVSREKDQDIALSLRSPDGVYVFRAHRDGEVVAAAAYSEQTRQTSMLGQAEAQKELNTEFAYWTRAVTDSN